MSRKTEGQAIRVVHYGNYGTEAGGISSVIREYVGWQWPGCRVDAFDTYATSAGCRGFDRLLVALFHVVRERSRTDIAHIHVSIGGSFLREGLIARVARWLGLKVVVTVHGSSFPDFAHRRPRLVRSVLGDTSRVCVLNDTAQRAIVDLGLPVPEIVPNSVMDVTAKSVSTSRGPTAMFAGAVSRRKGCDLLAIAWPRVVANVPGATLSVYGPEVDVELRELPNVQVLGPVPREAVRQAMQTHAVLVLPSRAEGMPMAVIEAMSAGCAVVASRVGALPELLGSEGLQLVPPEGVEELVVALTALLSDERRASRVGAGNRRTYEARYSPAATIEVLEGVYRDANVHNGRSV